MSDMAKEARKAMKAKAQRLGGDRPTEKVDSSTWTPPAMLNADVKTGLRPISRRAFKSGGKVDGEQAKTCMSRKPRQSGGKALTADSMINKNVKEANDKREGVKHVGALKSGGRAKKMGGGPMMNPMGGPTMGPVAGANQMMQRAAMTGGVPSAMLNFAPGIKRGSLSPLRATGMKKGGKAEGHEDVAADKALIKKMVKPEARTGKKEGGGKWIQGAIKHPGALHKALHVPEGEKIPAKKLEKAAHSSNPKLAKRANLAKTLGRMHRATGGEVFSGPGYPGKVPGVTGDRKARATGGKTGKGKTDINIMIGAHQPPGGMPMGAGPLAGPTRPPGMPAGPGGVPVPVPPAAGAPAGMPMPMPIPMPMPMAGGAPAPRKRGGRTYSSYKDMDAGAGSGDGRLEKSEIARKTARIEKGNY